MTSEKNAVKLRLHDIAHGRAGDKGNRVNISLIAYEPACYELLAEQVTCACVLELFASRGATRATRFDLPLLHAFNFVIDNALEGGVNGSMNLDGHGKTLSFKLLGLPVWVPRHLAPPAALLRLTRKHLFDVQNGDMHER